MFGVFFRRIKTFGNCKNQTRNQTTQLKILQKYFDYRNRNVSWRRSHSFAEFAFRKNKFVDDYFDTGRYRTNILGCERTTQ